MPWPRCSSSRPLTCYLISERNISLQALFGFLLPPNIDSVGGRQRQLPLIGSRPRSSNGTPARRQPLFCRGGPVKSTPPTILQDTAQGQSLSWQEYQPHQRGLAVNTRVGASNPAERH